MWSLDLEWKYWTSNLTEIAVLTAKGMFLGKCGIVASRIMLVILKRWVKNHSVVLLILIQSQNTLSNILCYTDFEKI